MRTSTRAAHKQKRQRVRQTGLGARGRREGGDRGQHASPVDVNWPRQRGRGAHVTPTVRKWRRRREGARGRGGRTQDNSAEGTPELHLAPPHDARRHIRHREQQEAPEPPTDLCSRSRYLALCRPMNIATGKRARCSARLPYTQTHTHTYTLLRGR